MSFEDGPAVSAGRDKLALALDVADQEAALLLAKRLRPWFSVAKVGLELFVAAGPDVVRALVDEDFEVFLDLKLHDIPNTVGRAAARGAELGASYITAHTVGGEAMLLAAVEGFAEATANGANGRGILGVTVLTSEPDAPENVLRERAERAARTGCAGIVCAASDLAALRGVAGSLKRVVPGIRLPESSTDDQSRVATPGSALASGGDLLVVGRTVTAAPDMEAAARLVTADLALNGSGSI